VRALTVFEGSSHPVVRTLCIVFRKRHWSATHGHTHLREAATAQFTTRSEMTFPALLTRYSTFWPPLLTTYT